MADWKRWDCDVDWWIQSQLSITTWDEQCHRYFDFASATWLWLCTGPQGRTEHLFGILIQAVISLRRRFNRAFNSTTRLARPFFNLHSKNRSNLLVLYGIGYTGGRSFLDRMRSQGMKAATNDLAARLSPIITSEKQNKTNPKPLIWHGNYDSAVKVPSPDKNYIYCHFEGEKAKEGVDKRHLFLSRGPVKLACCKIDHLLNPHTSTRFS